MKFKKLSLLGFKSFANKTNIVFGDGITAIVGPNGCGKSNVADAVRWVLGEQSPKLLRGANMQDVIFAGTEKRSAQSYAEVSLTFDNKNRSLFPSYEYEEVVISRKLFRSGESEYYRNGSRCLLRDISEMLRDAGFATEGYTVIGQNKAMEIVNSKPEDRRLIFEEAAGITKYKYRKNAAENKNKRTRENLSRIDDAMQIDLSRLEPLTKQAEKARLALELKERLKHHEINLYINRYETASARKDALSAVIADIDAQISEKHKEYDEAFAEYASAMDELRNIDSRIDGYRNELVSLTMSKTQISDKIVFIKEKLDAFNAQNSALQSSNAELADNYNKLTFDAEERQAEYNRKTEELNVMRVENEKLDAEYGETSARVTAEEQKIESARRALMAAMERKVAVSKSVGELTAERANAEEHAELLRNGISAAQKRLDEGGAELAERAEKLETYARERGELQAEQQRKAEESKQCEERLSASGTRLVETREKCSVAVSRKKLLEDLIKSMEGYAAPVRRLLNDAKNDSRLQGLIKGVVGQIISVKDGFGTAIETALGSAVNNIVTADEDDAKSVIDYLKRHNYGRATFLPITSFKPRSIEPQYLPLLKRAGCYGAATYALDFDPYFTRVIDGLLGSTVIVDNMDTAVKLAKDSGYAFRIVTLDGDTIFPQGSMSGGSKTQNMTNVLTYERELKDMVALVESSTAEVKAVESERAELTRASESLNARLRELISDIHVYEVTEASKTAEFVTLKDELTAVAAKKTADEAALAALVERIENISLDLDAVERTDDAEQNDNGEENAKARAEFDALRARNDALREQIAQRRVLIATLGKDLEGLHMEIARLKSEAIATSQRIDDNEMTLLRNNRVMQELNDEIISLSEKSSGADEARRNELKAKLDNMTQYKEDLNAKSIHGDRVRMECGDAITELTEKKHAQEIELTRVDSSMDELQKHIQDDYGLGYEDCLPFKVEEYNPESGELEISKLKRRIINLGSINENAIEDAQELSKTYNERKKQRDDLVNSLNDTEQIIKEMSAKMVEGFDSCFEQIRHNFQETFVQLFNGGSADLELIDNEDPLQRGVEIIAQPPSKKLQSISLLSGGEKTLTSVAVLFAILKLRPMPFCLLDEIEAALDDANVGRVAEMLKQFSSKTQLIAITHRKPTMEQADSLYGVTMEEKGVSTIVSVHLADAVKSATSVAVEE